MNNLEYYPPRDMKCIPSQETKKFMAEVQAKGLKYDNEKPRMDLLDPSFLEGVASVLSFGAKKYTAHNWRNGIELSRLIAACYRHLGTFNKGENLDKESGINHLYHAACCLMFASWMVNNKPELDDRWKPFITEKK